MAFDKRFVYVLRNRSTPVRYYTETRALKLERYLKSGSGVAFAKRHLRSRVSTAPTPTQRGKAAEDRRS
jgi:hypothetical protein